MLYIFLVFVYILTYEIELPNSIAIQKKMCIRNLTLIMPVVKYLRGFANIFSECQDELCLLGIIISMSDITSGKRTDITN